MNVPLSSMLAAKRPLAAVPGSLVAPPSEACKSDQAAIGPLNHFDLKANHLEKKWHQDHGWYTCFLSKMFIYIRTLDGKWLLWSGHMILQLCLR